MKKLSEALIRTINQLKKSFLKLAFHKGIFGCHDGNGHDFGDDVHP
ncbi:hypothetical protein [Kosmotoga arenicorallina]|nr:hypothetical protein [Kosmotoga arenicorallina]